MTEHDETLALWKAQHEEMLKGQDGSKYAGPDFNDPVVRCASCQQLITRKAIRKLAHCPKCGNRRVSNLRSFTEEEEKWMKEHNVDPDFLALFETVEDPDE